MQAIERTLAITGAGGAGKGPLDFLIKESITRIEPHRLRRRGPRNSNDKYYAHPNLRNELRQLAAELGDEPQRIPSEIEDIEWFPRAKLLLFTVRRHEWQCLVLGGLQGPTAKAEVYGPVLSALLQSEIGGLMGLVDVILLNPASTALSCAPNLRELKEETEMNCTLRGDTPESVAERVAAVEEEVPFWQELLETKGATEFVGWQYPEYSYKAADVAPWLARHQQNCLIRARQRLLEGRPSLNVYLKTIEEIRRGQVPFLK